MSKASAIRDFAARITALNTFPRYSDGDVEIVFCNTGERFVLHKHTLALHSPWFRASLSERWRHSGETIPTVSESTAISLFSKPERMLAESDQSTWAYELRFERGSADGILLRKGAVTSSEMIGDASANPEGDHRELFLERRACHDAHENMFRALYHVPPAFHPDNLDQAKGSITEMMQVAGIYGCKHIVKTCIDAHLGLNKHEVLEQCASAPA